MVKWFFEGIRRLVFHPIFWILIVSGGLIGLVASLIASSETKESPIGYVCTVGNQNLVETMRAINDTNDVVNYKKFVSGKTDYIQYQFGTLQSGTPARILDSLRNYKLV